DPDDPAKVGFLSTWMGDKGGGLKYESGMDFSLIDQNSGKKVYSGKTVLSKSQKDPEDKKGKNYNGTDVYMMDFSDFNKPGEYQLAVEGVGTSFSFEIGEKTWENAFETSARGMYHQRSGIALKEPYTESTRPRAFHPQDGVKVYQSEVALMDTSMGLNSQNDAFKALSNTKTNELVTEAWGGWFDAGDWDRRAQHMEVSRLYLELAEINPSYFSEVDLNIPESNNNIPDIVDEALWGLDFFKRMQTPEGGIRGGVESAGHPKEFEASWQESQTIMAYGPGMWSSYMYAGVAARAAHVLQDIDPSRAKEYQTTAIKAMEWAEKEFASNQKKLPTEVGDERNLAAAELYRLTGEDKWHQLFLDTTVFTDSNAKVFQHKSHNQENAAFVYSRTERNDVDKSIQKNALDAISQEANSQIDAVNNTGFKWNKNPYTSLGWGESLGSPEATTLLRAHALTNDQKYLEAGVLASQFSAGANPDNMVYTTGLGYRSPQDPLIVDLQATGDTPPPGITVYGPLDTQAYGKYWALDKMPEISPNPAKWPVAEGYFDFFYYVPVTEYTIQQTMAPTAYAWGYLAASDEQKAKPQSNPIPANPTPIDNPSPENKDNNSEKQVEDTMVSSEIDSKNTSKIRYEAEELNLDGYVVEVVNNSGASGGKHISLKGGENTGKATGVFQGESGKYEVKVGYYDENDGISSATVKIADKSTSFQFDEDLPSNWAKPQALTSKTVHDEVELNSGDRFEISGQKGGGEFARFDYIEFTPINESNNNAVKGSSQTNNASNNTQNNKISSDSKNNQMTATSADNFTQEVLQLTNEFRKENGLSPLSLNSDLVEAAQSYSEDMGENDFFSHTGQDGSTPLTRAQEAGYSPNAVGENIAAGQTTPEQVVQGWIDSPGHRENLLNPNYTEIGIGHFYLEEDTGNVNYNHYWTQLFGRSQDMGSSNNGNTNTENTNNSDNLQISQQNNQASQKDDSLTGGTGNDTLSGTDNNDEMFGNAGNDTLKGKKGDDWLQGDRGNDNLIGGAGNDFLIGTKPGTSGKDERDTLQGGKGADMFALGDKTGIYYDNGKSADHGFTDYALVKDFNSKEGDKILLHGKAENYRLGSVSGSKSGTGILHKDSGKDELIAIVENTSGLKLESNAFQFIG
ncbi:MAG: glycoside hydrolase family 9 protein, partial [Cyanobacteria bacterium P01_A01_bin.45]